MGLAISKLDTLDATEHMARSWQRWTLRGGKCTGFPSDNAHHIIQCPLESRYTICPKEEATTSEATAPDQATDPSRKLDMETSRRLHAKIEGDKQREAISSFA